MANWSQKPAQVGPNNGGGGNWLTLTEGTYKLRLVSGYEYIGYHFNNATKKSTVCPNREPGDDECELCRMLKDGNGKLYEKADANAIQAKDKKAKFYYNKPSQRYMVNVLDLDDLDEDGTAKVKHCEFPYKLIDIITAYAMDPEYKFETLPSWDMTVIRKNGETQMQVDWQCLPARTNREISENEQAAIDEAESPSVLVGKKHKYAQEDAYNNQTEPPKEDKEEIDIEDVELKDKAPEKKSDKYDPELGF